MFWYGLVEYDMVQCFGMVWFSMVRSMFWYGLVEYGMDVWSMFWYGLVEYDMVQCFGMVCLSMIWYNVLVWFG
jgi:hypothetical protein